MPEPLSDHLLVQLDREISGEVRNDTLHRRLYSTDASVYQEMPLGVCFPKNPRDCEKIVRWAATHGIPLIPRTAGTSLAGQVVGSGLVVDVSRHMTAFLELDVDKRRIRVEPGVIQDDLNDEVAPHQLQFGPDTATSNRCMIGGMIGNNSCGTHSILYGTTRDHVLELNAILSDGSSITARPLSAEELEGKKSEQTLEGRIYRELFDLVDRNRDLILQSFPHPSVVRRNGGYALDRLALQRPWNPDGALFNLVPFFCGSEGTLGLVTEATLNLVPKPKATLIVAAHFQTLAESARAAVVAVGHKPAAVELIDDIILRATESNIEQKRNRDCIQGSPGAVLAIEFYGYEGQAPRAKAEELIEDLRKNKLGYAYPILEGPDSAKILNLRKAGLGLIMGIPGDRKPATVIEDTAVPVAELPAYVERLQALMKKYDLECCFYAHASVGELHVRPALNLKDPVDREKFKGLARDAADLVKSFGGSNSGEHGDGRLRSPFNERMFGSEVYALFRRIKKLFDPQTIFNPHKIVDAHPIDHQWRFSTEPKHDPPTYFDWSADQGLLRATEKCNGAGDCRKSAGRGTMCPSYMATKEELHSTRGRANLFRQLLNEPAPEKAFGSEDLYQAMDLCLSCKGCKSECPATVDLARLKAEFLQQRHDQKGVPLRSRLFGEYGTIARWSRWTPGLATWLANTRAGKRFMGIHPDRTVPAFASQTFFDWWKKHRPHPNAGKRGQAVLFCDLFTNHEEPDVGKAAVEVLERAGFELIVPAGVESARTQISKGLLRRAAKILARSVEILYPFAEKGLPIVGLEPSAILTFRDEAVDLVRDVRLKDKARMVATGALLFEEFMVRENKQGKLDLLAFKTDRTPTISIHGHCHQKALVGMKPLVEALKIIPNAKITTIPSGCCGMAGSFGYEAEHYKVSMDIGELVLFPAVRAMADDVEICAPGTSCRHQIKDGTKRKALHPAQIVRGWLVEG